MKKTDNIRLVLVSCCAPCSCGAMRQLQGQGADFIVLFYNPNIYPDTEYQKRLSEQIRYCDELGVKYFVGDYDHEEWLLSVQGLESEPERGARCAQCFRHRFRYARQFALRNGYDAIASVLGVSRHKDQAQVDAAAISELGISQSLSAIGGESCDAPDIRYIPIKWDEDLRAMINKKSGFYHQNYCGCEFSGRK